MSEASSQAVAEDSSPAPSSRHPSWLLTIVLSFAVLVLLSSIGVLWMAAHRLFSGPVNPTVALVGDAKRVGTNNENAAKNNLEEGQPNQQDSESMLARASSVVRAHGNAWDDEVFDRFRSGAPAVAQPSDGQVAPENRWRFQFPKNLTTGTYAEQLDALGIELGVLVGDGTIAYATKLTQAMPVTRTAPASEENRVYLSWSRGDLEEADRELLAKAKIESAGNIVLHFCSEETRSRLFELEKTFKDADPEEILRTRFGVKPELGGFTFYVLDQQTRQ